MLLEAEKSDPDFLTYLWVEAETGGRRGETLALRWSGVSFDTGAVTVAGTVSIGDDGSQLRSTTKSKKPRRVGVSSITLEYLRAHKDRVEELLSTAAGEPVEVEPDWSSSAAARAAAATRFTPGPGARSPPAAGSVN